MCQVRAGLRVVASFSDKDYPQGRASRQEEEKACPPTGAGEGRVASVIRLNSDGSTAIEKMGLSVEQAKELATRLWEAGEPAGCAWCVRLDENEEETSDRP